MEARDESALNTGAADRAEAGEVDSELPALVRLFVALPLPEAVCGEIARAQAELRRALVDSTVSWARVEQLHLTLRFLGWVESARLPELNERLASGLAAMDAVNLECAGAGCFPDARRPRVAWVGVSEPAGRLSELHQRVNAAVGDFAAAPAEDVFVGHITVGRIKRFAASDTARWQRWLEAAAARRFGGWLAREVLLFRSELLPTGARHTVLNRFALRA
ncbi:MAG: RNA 2',3'-cyclic phosphodiesterase [Verrucomicrobiae bacterium]|nr:RNA 2',3'-cyclic phosphodiesterase [Verrucomicrobiae bacterium]